MKHLTMVILEPLVVHASLIFVHSTHTNFNIDPNNWFLLGYSNLHKGFKCLGVAAGHVYISRDVVFDETMFPFAKLNPNACARLQAEVLLLPHHSQPPHVPQCGDDLIGHQHTNASIIPVATNSVLPCEHHAENLVENDEEIRRNNGEEEATVHDNAGDAGFEVDHAPTSPVQVVDNIPWADTACFNPGVASPQLLPMDSVPVGSSAPLIPGGGPSLVVPDAIGSRVPDAIISGAST
jgi:hypothetical protein